MPTPSLREEGPVILFNPLLVGGKRVNVFPKGIRPKINIIEGLEFELDYFVAAFQPLGHGWGNPPCKILDYLSLKRWKRLIDNAFDLFYGERYLLFKTFYTL